MIIYQQQHSTSVPHRRGIALMLVMVAILVTGSMAIAYFGSRDNSITISANIASASKARIVAESGLDLAIAILETDAEWRTNHIEGIILQDHQIGDGTITITILDAETEQPPTESTLEVSISVSSTVEGRTQVTKASATIFPDDGELDVDYSEFAIFAEEEITMLGASSVQNWSASPNTLDQHVRIGTLATNPMSVQMQSVSQNTALQLHAPENASSMISSTLMSTSQFTDVPPFLTPPSPPIEYEPLYLEHEDSDIESLEDWANLFTSNHSNFHDRSQRIVTLQEGSYETEEFSLTSRQNVVVHGDVVLIVEDEFTMKNANITLSKNATLTLHIGGDVKIASSYIGNENQSTQSWMNPSLIKLYGQDDADWHISGTSTIKGELYAPSCEIELSGNSTVCGRIAGKEVMLRGASRVLYDPSLDNGGFADEDSPIYDDDGSIRSELKQLTQLNPALLDSLVQTLLEYDSHSPRSFHSDWRSTPTVRHHEVIYMLLVYGVDARSWESLSRETSDRNYSKHATVVRVDER